jgi:hypothetical protein
MKNLGIILLIIGLGMTIYTGFTFVTKKKVVDMGPLEINKEEKHPVSWSPVAGIVCVAAGISLILIGKKK